MAATVNTLNIKGLFNANKFQYTDVGSNSKYFEFSVPAADSKDPVYLILDYSNVIISDTYLEIFSVDGKKVTKIVPLVHQMNIIPLTSFGYKNKDGVINCRLNGGNSVFTSDMNIRIAAFSHTAVENH